MSAFESALSSKFDGRTVRSWLGFARFPDRKIDDQFAELVWIAWAFGALDHSLIMINLPANSKASMALGVKLMHYQIFFILDTKFSSIAILVEGVLFQIDLRHDGAGKGAIVFVKETWITQ